MITLKNNKGLNLKIPVFTCDGDLGTHLNKYDMLTKFNGYYFSGFIWKTWIWENIFINLNVNWKKKR